MTTKAIAVGMTLMLARATALRGYRKYCVPNCVDQNDGSKVPDPIDCHQFYYCVNNLPSADPFRCPEGQVFAKESKECIEGSSCEITCTNPCNYECAVIDSPTLISDRFDCRIYYECLSKVAPGPPKFCPQDKPFFDGLVCQEEESECCSCLAYCFFNDIIRNVMDPKDCDKYYLCLDVGFPQNPATCPSGRHFDPMSGTCSGTAPCITLCPNVVGGDGCIDKFTCEGYGYFAKCPQRCDPRYYHCLDTDTGHFIEADTCTSGRYFHPNTRHCVRRSECPYPDPGPYTQVTNRNFNSTWPHTAGADGSSSSCVSC